VGPVIETGIVKSPEESGDSLPYELNTIYSERLSSKEDKDKDPETGEVISLPPSSAPPLILPSVPTSPSPPQPQITTTKTREKAMKSLLII